MIEVLKKLEHVQELDSQIGNILRKKAEFPVRLEGFRAEIDHFNKKIQTLTTQIDDMDKGRVQQHGVMEMNEDRVKKSQEKLEGIKTNQEYQAIIKEVEGLKKNNQVLTDSSEKIAAEVERLTTEKKSLEESRKIVQAKLDEESSKISGEEQGFDGELKRLQSLRADGIIGIDRGTLAAYDRVRSGNKSGVGIVPAVAGTCKGCHMRIPPQMYNELQRGKEIHACPSCRRILVYKESAQS